MGRKLQSCWGLDRILARFELDFYLEPFGASRPSRPSAFQRPLPWLPASILAAVFVSLNFVPRSSLSVVWF